MDRGKQKTEYELDGDVVIITTKTVEFLLSQNPDALSLYLFYIKNSKIQKTNSIWCKDVFCQKGLGWGKVRFNEAKKTLLDSKLIDITQTRDTKGKINGWYVKINYLFSGKKTDELLSEAVHKHQNQQVDTTTSGYQETNALSNKSINALSNKTEMQYSDAKESDLPPVKSNVTLSEKRGTTPIKRLINLYGELFSKEYGFTHKYSFGAIVKVFKGLLSHYSEVQVATLLIIYFQWKGMRGNEQKERDFLVTNTFSPFLFSSSINKYEAYVRNVLQIKEFDDDEKMVLLLAKMANAG